MGVGSEELIQLGRDELVNRFTRFLKQIEKYDEELSLAIVNRRRSLIIDFNDLLLYDKQLADYLMEKPSIVIDSASEAVGELIREKDPEYASQVAKFYARFRLSPIDRMSIRRLRSEHLGRFVSIEGIVLRQTPPMHYVRVAKFRCNQCGYEVTVTTDTYSSLQPPKKCPQCGAVNSMMFVTDESIIADWQKILVQEKPEETPSGQLPRSIEAVLTDDLVDTVKPGDRVMLSGVLEINLFEPRRGKLPVFSRLININYVESLQKEFAEIEITPQDEQEIRRLAMQPDVRDRIIASIAPSIYGLDDIKEAIACLLFGGVPKELPDGTRIRGDVHVLLVGDPGTAKSQLLKYVARIAPRAVYTTGKGSTAAGLTAAVVRDGLTGEFYLEAGALVLADMGVAVVDEIDKMDAKDRVAMHEAMEQQTVSIAKAGILATLNARASVLAAANPAFGRYLPNRTVAENVDLPVTLLSRFDLIFIIRDEPNADRDKAVAEHVTKLHAGEVTQGFRNMIKVDLLRKYIAYARKYIKPVLTPEARDRIVGFYTQMRARSVQEAGSPVAITARQLEALIRLTEAEAKMRLSSIATAEDAERAIRLFMKFLQSVGIDMETGNIDIDVIMTGKPRSQQEKIALLMSLIAKLEQINNNKPIKVEELYKEAENEGLDRATVDKILSILKSNGEVYMPKQGYIKRTTA